MVLAMNKSAIMEKAVAIANEQGLENVTIANLSRAFSVKPPSLYKHIENINAIMEDLAVLCMQELIHIIQSECFGLSGDRAIVQFCHSSRSFALRNPGLYQAMHIYQGKEYRELAVSLIDMISKMLAPYNIEKNKIIHVIRHLRALLHGFTDLEIKNGFAMQEKISDSFSLAVSGFVYQLHYYGHKGVKNEKPYKT